MKSRLLIAAALAGISCSAAAVQAKNLTLCWAAWEPAHALAQLSKEFEAHSGHTMNYKFVPWPSFAELQDNLGSGSLSCDLLIGEIHRLGEAAENGHYVKLNDFLDAEDIDVDDFASATIQAATWPNGTPNYFALPVMADAVGWVYRKDWFSNPDIKTAYAEATGEDLREPQSQRELMQVARFFQGRDIDGQTVNGASIFTDRDTEGITIGATGALLAWGVRYDNMPGLNAPNAAEAIAFYKDLFDCCAPPEYTNSYVDGALDVFKSGQVAMAMNWFTFFPGLIADPNIGGDRIGFFANPPQDTDASVLGGQALSVLASSGKQDAALEYIKWFSDAEVQAKWWNAGGFSTHTAVLNDAAFEQSQPFAAAFRTAVNSGQNVWQGLSSADFLRAMQSRLHDHIVTGESTAKDTLDKLVEDWNMLEKDD